MPDSNGKSSPAGGGLQARIAQSLADREAAYRLRYEVYVAEQGKPYPQADHVNRLLADALDDEAQIIVAESDGDTVGTLRNNWLSSPATYAEYADLLGVNHFGSIPLERIAISSRLVFHPSYRFGAGRARLFDFNYECGAEKDTKLCFMLCVPQLAPLFKRIGYREYAAPVGDPVVGCLHRLCLEFDDLAYLVRIRSPFVAVAERLGIEATDRPWLTTLLPETSTVHG